MAMAQVACHAKEILDIDSDNIDPHPQEDTYTGSTSEVQRIVPVQTSQGRRYIPLCSSAYAAGGGGDFAHLSPFTIHETCTMAFDANMYGGAFKNLGLNMNNTTLSAVNINLSTGRVTLPSTPTLFMCKIHWVYTSEGNNLETRIEDSSLTEIWHMGQDGPNTIGATQEMIQVGRAMLFNYTAWDIRSVAWTSTEWGSPCTIKADSEFHFFCV
jgi:hypothetical protein